MGSLQYYLSELKRLIPQAADELPPGSLEERLGDAIRAYSRIRPYEPDPIDYDGDGTTYDFNLPNAWDKDFSKIQSIEYPLGYQDPSYLEPDEYFLYHASTGWKLRLLVTPADGKTMRVNFITLHRLTPDGDDTIPERDKRAFCWLAASLVARNLAAKYAGFTDPSMAADVIVYRTKQREYSDLATQFETFYKAHFGMGVRDIVPAAGNWGRIDFNLDTRYGVTPP